MKFKKAKTHGVCTSTYFIYLERKYTIDEFIKTILKERSDEWGDIIIDNKKIASYTYGELDNEISSEVLFKTIDYVDGHHSCDMMDYMIYT